MKKYLPFIISEMVILFMCLALLFSIEGEWARVAVIVAFGAFTILNTSKTYPDKEKASK